MTKLGRNYWIAWSLLFSFSAQAVDVQGLCWDALRSVGSQLNFKRLEADKINEAETKYKIHLMNKVLPKEAFPKTAEEKLGLLLAARSQVIPWDKEVNLEPIPKSRLKSRRLRKELGDLDLTKKMNEYDLEDVYDYLTVKGHGDPKSLIFLARNGWALGRREMRRRTYEKDVARHEIAKLFEELGVLGPPTGLKKLARFTEKYATPIEVGLTGIGLVPLLSGAPPAHQPKFSLLSLRGKTEELNQLARKIGFDKAYDSFEKEHRLLENIDLGMKLSERALQAAFIGFLAWGAYQQTLGDGDDTRKKIRIMTEELKDLDREIASVMSTVTEAQVQTPSQLSNPELDAQIKKLKIASNKYQKVYLGERDKRHALRESVKTARTNLEKAGFAAMSGWGLLLLRRKGVQIVSRLRKDPVSAAGGLLLGGGAAGTLGTYGVAMDMKELEDIETLMAEIKANEKMSVTIAPKLQPLLESYEQEKAKRSPNQIQK